MLERLTRGLIRDPGVLRSSAARYAGALLIAIASILLRHLLDPIFVLRAPRMTTDVAVAISAWLFGFGPGLLTTALCESAAAWLYLAPAGALWATPADRISLLVSTLSAIAVVTIVASLKRALTELAMAKEAAEKANESKDRFLSMTAHELRTPLNSIVLSTSLLRRGPHAPERVAAAVERIDRATRNMTEMVDELVDSARISSGQFKIAPVPIDLVIVVQSAVELMRPSADAKRIALIANIGPGPATVNGDPRRLQESLSNLLDNAIKFTPNDGRIEVSVAVLHGQVQVSVKDTGMGIEGEFLPRVFERFAQADPKTPGYRNAGLGLGLSIVKHIVELHGGTIAAHSEGRERGARFTIALPISEAD
jgi:signal transduction histidine kinase